MIKKLGFVALLLATTSVFATVPVIKVADEVFNGAGAESLNISGLCTTNQVLACPNGLGHPASFRALVGADLPKPTATTLGGVESLAAVTSNWINAISTSGVPSATQPACGDLSNAANSCSVDATNASNISSGTLGVGEGGLGITSTPSNGQIPIGNGTHYVASTITAGANITVTNAPGSITIASTASGSGPAISSVQNLEQKSDNEHFLNIQTDPIDNAVSSGFATQPSGYYTQGFLMLPLYAGANTVTPVWNPWVLNTGDPNLDSTTNWSTENQSGSLAASTGMPQVGAKSLTFTCAGAGTACTIQYAAAAATQNISNNTDLYLLFYLGSTTNLTDIKVVIDIDGTNMETYTATKSIALTGTGTYTSLATGWQLLYFDLANPGTAAGTGWNSTQAFRYFHVGVDKSSAQTYSLVSVDGIFFSQPNPTNLIALGSELSFFDGTNRENNILDHGNTIIAGSTGITLANNAVNKYLPGIGTSDVTLTRNTLSIGSNVAGMTNNANSNYVNQYGQLLSGGATTTQEVRLSRVLRSALSGGNTTLNAFADVYTPQVYLVGATTATGAKLTDVSQTFPGTAGDLITNDVMHCFSTVWLDAKRFFTYLGDLTLTSNSTYSGGNLTIAATGGGSVLNTVAPGAYCAKKSVIASLSSIAASGANESFSTLSPNASPDGIIMYDSGLSYPYPGNVWAHWKLGGLSYADALNNQYGPGPALTVTGTPSITDIFKNGLLGVAGFTASNYYSLTGSQAGPIDGSLTNALNLAWSIWLYWDGTNTNGSDQMLFTTLSGAQGSGGNGISLFLTPSAKTLTYYTNDGTNGPSVVVSGLIANSWNHIFVQHTLTAYSNGVVSIYVNGALAGSSTSFGNGGPASSAFSIGATVTGGATQTLNTTNALADFTVWRNAPIFTPSQVLSLAQSPGQLGFYPHIKYRYQSLGNVGQTTTYKVQLNTDTNNIRPTLLKAGVTP